MNIGQLRRFLPYSADERVTGSNVTLDDADHLLSEKEDSIYVGKVLGTWSERYI